MGNELTSRKPAPVRPIARRNYHAPFPPKRANDYKDPRNKVLPGDLPVKPLRSVKPRFQPIPGIPETEENTDFVEVDDIDGNSNMGSLQNLNLIGGRGGCLDDIAKNGVIPNGVIGNGHAVSRFTDSLADSKTDISKRKHKPPAPAPPNSQVKVPPPAPPLPPQLPSLSNSSVSFSCSVSQNRDEIPVEDKSFTSKQESTQSASGQREERRASTELQSQLIENIRKRLSRAQKRPEPIDKPRTPLEMFQCELSAACAVMEERRKSNTNWEDFEKKKQKTIQITDSEDKLQTPNSDDNELGAEINILSLSEPIGGESSLKKGTELTFETNQKKKDWVPAHDLKSDVFEEREERKHAPIVLRSSTNEENLYMPGLHFNPSNPSLSATRGYRSKSQDSAEKRRRKSPADKYSSSLRSFKKNIQNVFSSLSKSTKDRGSVQDLFGEQRGIRTNDIGKFENDEYIDDEDVDDDDDDDEEIDLRSSRRHVTFSNMPVQTREVVHYPGEEDVYVRRPMYPDQGYYGPLYQGRRSYPFDSWYEEALRYPPVGPYRYFLTHGRYPNDYNYYSPYVEWRNDERFYIDAHGIPFVRYPVVEKPKKGKFSLRSRRRKWLEENRGRRQPSGEKPKTNDVSGCRDEEEYTTNWDLLRDDIQYDSGIVSSRIRPTKHLKEKIHHRRSRSAPASGKEETHWEVYDEGGNVMVDNDNRHTLYQSGRTYEVNNRFPKQGSYDEQMLTKRMTPSPPDDPKHARRRLHAPRKNANGDVISSSSDENKPPPKVLKSVLDEFDDIINDIPRDYSSPSSEDEDDRDVRGLGSMVNPIETSMEREPRVSDASITDREGANGVGLVAL